jgi:methyl-accepting chemotaxis protein
MSFFYNLKLRSKVTAGILSVTTLLESFILLFLYFTTKSIIEERAYQATKDRAGQEAASFENILEEPLVAARTLAESFIGLKRTSNTSRETVISSIKKVMEDNPFYLS